jgi:hypothetical protein
LKFLLLNSLTWNANNCTNIQKKWLSCQVMQCACVCVPKEKQTGTVTKTKTLTPLQKKKIPDNCSLANIMNISHLPCSNLSVDKKITAVHLYYYMSLNHYFFFFFQCWGSTPGLDECLEIALLLSCIPALSPYLYGSFCLIFM